MFPDTLQPMVFSVDSAHADFSVHNAAKVFTYNTFCSIGCRAAACAQLLCLATFERLLALTNAHDYLS